MCFRQAWQLCGAAKWCHRSKYEALLATSVSTRATSLNCSLNSSYSSKATELGQGTAASGFHGSMANGMARWLERGSVVLEDPHPTVRHSAALSAHCPAEAVSVRPALHVCRLTRQPQFGGGCWSSSQLQCKCGAHQQCCLRWHHAQPPCWRMNSCKWGGRQQSQHMASYKRAWQCTWHTLRCGWRALQLQKLDSSASGGGGRGVPARQLVAEAFCDAASATEWLLAAPLVIRLMVILVATGCARSFARLCLLVTS